MQPRTLETEGLEIYELRMVIQTLPSTLRKPRYINGLTKLKVLEALLQTKLLPLCNLLVYTVKQIIT